MAHGTHHYGQSPQWCWRPRDADQMIGGLRMGGMRELAITSDCADHTREFCTATTRTPSIGGGDMVWKHLTRHAPIDGHPFAGQSGQGFAGLWHGISPVDAAIECVAFDIAIACDDATGATSMAARCV